MNYGVTQETMVLTGAQSGDTHVASILGSPSPAATTSDITGWEYVDSQGIAVGDLLNTNDSETLTSPTRTLSGSFTSTVLDNITIANHLNSFGDPVNDFSSSSAWVTSVQNTFIAPDISSVVPEPAAALLIGSGLMALLITFRPRKSRT